MPEMICPGRCGDSTHRGCARWLATALLAALAWLAPFSANAQARLAGSQDGGVVTDSRTGLTWRRCSEGQAFDGVTCAGTSTAFTHEQALLHAKGQAGWRLPNVKELGSLVDRARLNPSIDPLAFPETESYYYWSSSPVADFPVLVWIVNFRYGDVDGLNRDYYGLLRLVR